MYCPVVVRRLLGKAMDGLLGSLSRFLGCHSPGTPDLGGPFLAASLWDSRCCMPFPSFILGLLIWYLGNDGSRTGCTFQCGWTCGTLRSFMARTSRKGRNLG